jgi:flagellar operon protein
MVEKLENILQLHPPVGSVRPAVSSKKIDSSQTQSGVSVFDNYLTEALKRPADVSFSAHAQKRLSSRGIEISNLQMSRLGKAVDLVNEKGGRDSLVVLDGLALIVNVPSRTVVTAMDIDGMSERVVTNIDSAVLG